MAHELPSLPYPPDALEPHIDKATMEIHHGRHHKAYVDNLNKAISGNTALEGKSLDVLIGDLASVPDNIRGPVRNNGGGHWNHSFFWKLMGPKAGGAPTGKLADDLKAAFGSFADFQARLENAGMTRFGSGWAWLVARSGKLEILATSNAATPITMGATPLLAIDVWEHAYYLDYENRRPEFVEAVIDRLLNWEFAAEQLEKAQARYRKAA